MSTVLNPAGRQQGMLWFTHELIGLYKDYVSYAKQHGTHLVTYPLECWKHEQIEHLADGSMRSVVPAEIEVSDDTPDGAD
ncbi:MAG: hypothetical protein LC753_03330, partial [Acidobacteria bacterium]|nr:hypothetical protein [Acidobacteriota bacterium]MCA1649331.1 hypothetical protein [Acidobacteriota bacterium]